jgi:TusE/DsrC/DsvC family sulfur relay protein
MAEDERIISTFDTSSPLRSDRRLELQNWNETQAQRIAEQEGIELTDAHWAVIYCLRDYYLENGLAQSGRELGDMLDREFTELGGRKYLHRLFPHGPVAQGMRIAGLPLPAYTVDAGFGSTV